MLRGEAARRAHHVADADLDTVAKNTPYVWVLSDLVQYATPIPFTPKRGSVVWCVQGIPLTPPQTTL